MMLLVLAAPARGEEGSRAKVPSVPAKLDAIQATVSAIETGVNLINPAVIRPVTLATADVFVYSTKREIECRATNVGLVPIPVTITIFDGSSGAMVETRDVTLAPRTSDRVYLIFAAFENGRFWCAFNFDGPLGAVRAHLAVYGYDPEPRILAVTEAR